MLDVLVVGGGPAGASTAIWLARQGLSVGIVERASFPRRKACGEGLFPGGSHALADLQVLQRVLRKSRVLQSLRLEVGDVAAEASLPTEPHPAIGIRRDVLDTALLEEAGYRGVDVIGATAVDLTREADSFRGVRLERGEIDARAIVLADGLRSRLRRAAGLDAPTSGRRYGVTAHYELAEDAPAQVRIRALDKHEVYYTPVGQREVNVALLLGGSEARGLAGDLTGSYETLIRASGVLPPTAVRLEPPQAAGPFPAAARRLWRDNLILAGDAAGFFDGISGEGISIALRSSKLAADAVCAYLADGKPEHFRHYQRTRRRLARDSTLLARLSLFLAAHPSVARHAVRNLRRHPESFARIVAINCGIRAPSAVSVADFRKLLLGR